MGEGLGKVIWGRVWSVSLVAESESKAILVVLTRRYTYVNDVLQPFVDDISEAQVQTVPNLLIATVNYSTSSVSTKYIQSAVYNHWTGLVDWTGGLDWWTDAKSHFHGF